MKNSLKIPDEASGRDFALPIGGSDISIFLFKRDHSRFNIFPGIQDSANGGGL